MAQLFSNRWVALAEFVYTVVISALIVVFPQWGSWLVGLILLPWLVGLIFGRITFERSAVAVPIALIIITALIGVWAAYNQQAAVEKLRVILGAVAIFASLAHHPKTNLGVVASLVGLLGVFIAVIFLITNDWHSQSSDLELIRRTGDWIAAILPPANRVFIPPNFAGGLMAILVPIPLAISIYYWRAGQRVTAMLPLGMVIVILGGLFMTSSRGAWIALVVGSGLWLLWRFASYLASKGKKPPLLLFGLLLMITILPSIWLVSILPGGVVGLADQIPGLPTGGSRYELAVNTSKLIGDYPFTGGGLRSFPGQYSQYILVIPYFLFAYSHNFYLDVTFEQGFIGSLAIFGLIIGTAWMLMSDSGTTQDKPISRLLRPAVLTSIFVLLVHGLVDDPLYGDLGSPLLLLIPGFGILLGKEFQPGSIPEGESEQLENHASRTVINGRSWAVIIILLLLGVVIFRKPILASWYGNLGAVDMAKIDLAGWPKNQWDSSSDIDKMISAQEKFSRSVSFNPNQRTAWHRSGLIAVQGREFESAQIELERAYGIDPDHRGIKKSLGYVSAWNGDFEQALILLEGVEEAQDEMEVYAWWWQDNQRPELADQASNLARLLKLESSTP